MDFGNQVLLAEMRPPRVAEQACAGLIKVADVVGHVPVPQPDDEVLLGDGGQGVGLTGGVRIGLDRRNPQQMRQEFMIPRGRIFCNVCAHVAQWPLHGILFNQ